MNNIDCYDSIVIGIGHAGTEASLALAKTGCKTLALSVSLDNAGYLACNPSIGGTAKGHLVREVDALGGIMGIAADKCLIQLRMLNSSKGPAVRSLRAQVDKYAYHDYIKSTLENQSGLYLKQAEAVEILTENGKVVGVKTTQQIFWSKTVVLCCGVYLRSNIITGFSSENRGPSGFPPANSLSESLAKLGFSLRRFKTGTPARIAGDSVDFSQLEVQKGEGDIYSFSTMTKKVNFDKSACYLGYTNQKTHDIIRANLQGTARVLGLVTGAGARYCPSIEDKIVRFADKERHQFFLEPEGLNTKEMYVQGISTSLPADVQTEMYRSINGLENAFIMRDAYAIEYDCIDPTSLYPTLMSKNIDGLFFAGQINGTSGYEEAAAQGIIAGINASLFVRGKEGIIPGRDNSYIGVMIDDLVTKGTDEPYRMMTSRSEYRLCLRQDNADLRLTPIGREVGLVDDKRWRKYLRKAKDVKKALELISYRFSAAESDKILSECGESPTGRSLTAEEIIRRENVSDKIFCRLSNLFGGLDRDAVYDVFVSVKYEGYLLRQERTRKEQARLNGLRLDVDDYFNVSGLRFEAAEKLNKLRPLTVGQAARISGVNPADINVLLTTIKKNVKK